MCLSMAVLMMVTPAFAEELWDFHLRGVDEGLAAGALPPPGFYFINDFWFAPSFHGYGVWDAPGVTNPNMNTPAAKLSFNQSEANNARLFAYVDVPILVWVPGCTLFGAAYGAGIAQPFDFTALKVNLGASAGGLPNQQSHGAWNGVPGAFSLNDWTSGNQWGTYNTLIIPLILSWKVCDFRFKFAMDFGLNDGWNSASDSAMAKPAPAVPYTTAASSELGIKQVLTQNFFYHRVIIDEKFNHNNFNSALLGQDGNVYAWASNDSWQFTPNVGISWLHAGWNVSADFFYTWYTKDTDTNYQNGDEFAADYTITYTCGKWTFGLGAAQENQISNDKFAALLINSNGLKAIPYGSIPNTKNENYSMGPIVGYNFGPCSLMFTYNFALETKNDVGGDWFNLRLVVPLGNPCPMGK